MAPRGNLDLCYGHRGLAARLGARQVNPEGTAASRLAVHFDNSPALADDAVDDRQAQPGPLAHPLGGEERLEDTRLHVRTHATAAVAHLQNDVGPGRYLRVTSGVIG